MKRILSTLTVVLFIFSCNPGENNKINQLEWLVGTWKNDTPEGQLYEIWTKKNDSLYVGNSFMISNKDTVFSEKITLVAKGKDVFYIPTVNNQNNGKAVTFKMVSDTNKAFVFENKEHDFPQQIIYKNPTPDSLVARIEGTQAGKFRKEEFKMIRDRK